MINTTPAHMPPNPHQAPARADFRVLTPGDFRDGRTPPTPPPPLPPLLSPLNTSVGGMSPLSLRSGYQPSAHSSDLITSPGSTMGPQSPASPSQASIATTRPPTPGPAYPGGTPTSSEGPHTPINNFFGNARIYDSNYHTPMHSDPVQGFQSPMMRSPQPLDRNEFHAGQTPSPLRTSLPSSPPLLFGSEHAPSPPSHQPSERSGSRTPSQAPTPGWYAPTPGAGEFPSTPPGGWQPLSENHSPRSERTPSLPPTPGYYGFAPTPGGYMSTPRASSPAPDSSRASQQE